MRELRRVIRPGAKRLNWNSLGINDFISKCDSVRGFKLLIQSVISVHFQAISKFESMVNQIQKNAKDIHQRLSMIEQTNLFKSPAPKPTQELPSCKVRSVDKFKRLHRLMLF
jgi:dynein heavy chain